MLGAQLVKDHGAALRVIADELDSHVVLDRLDQLLGKLLERHKWLGELDARDFPMSGGRVFSLRRRLHPPIAAAHGRAGLAQHIAAHHLAQPEGAQRGQLEAGVALEDVAERVGPLVAIFRRIRRSSHSSAVENDYERPHQTPMGCQAVFISTVSRIQ